MDTDVNADLNVGFDVANVLFGPPAFGRDLNCMLGLFFASQGVHVICGGTTAQLAADFLHETLKIDLRYPASGLSPICHIDGVDLVTEGIVTMKRVLEHSQSVLCGCPNVPCTDDDGASLVWKHLSKALAVNLFVGCAENPCNASCGIAPGYRGRLAHELALNLSKLGKKVFERYF